MALLQEDLDSLEEWEHMWKMEFNPSKYVIHIMPNKQSPDSQLLPPWANTGNNKYQQVSGHHYQQ